MKELLGLSIKQIKDLLQSKKVTACEIASAHLQHLSSLESSLHAFNTITEDLAIAQAKAIDQLIASGAQLPLLAGIPLALKDNICVNDSICAKKYPTTCSSKILENFYSPYQATAAARLFAAGAVCVGKTNLDEFAMGSSTENSALKVTRNPWDTTKVPGGSSGGSAASVCSGSSVIALGSDTGGSVRQPASFCGIVGMKPTYGRVSRYGLVAFASSLDQVSTFGRSVYDAALALQVIAGHDPADSTSYPEVAPRFSDELETVTSLRGLKVGLIQELIGEGVEAEVHKALLAAKEVFEELGATVELVSMPLLKYSLPAYYLIATAEASSNLARYDGVKYGLRAKDCTDMLSMYMESRSQGFGQEVKRRIMLGTYALSSGYYDAYYKKAQQVRRLIKEQFDQEFKKFAILICPTSPTIAFAVGAKTSDPLTMYLSDIATIPANLAGLPAISLPCGFGQGKLPIGLQLIAPPLQDAQILKAAFAFEQATSFHKDTPPMLASLPSC